MEKSFKQKDCMEYCKYILINNPQFKKELINYIKNNNGGDTPQPSNINQWGVGGIPPNNDIINVNILCNQALGFVKD